MTVYELMDVRGTVSDSYMTTLKFWMTITLAVFGGANFAGPSTSLLSFVLLFVFYSGSSIGLGMYLHQLRNEIAAVEDDITALESDDTQSLKILSPKIIQSRNMNVTLQWVCAFGVPVIFGYYLYDLFSGF